MIFQCLLTSILLCFALSTPQDSPQCDNIPANPAASQIDPQYLEIPGCNGVNSIADDQGSGGSNRTSLAQSDEQIANTSSSDFPGLSNPPDSSPSSTSLVSSIPSASAIFQTSSFMDSSGGAVGQLYNSSITRYGQGPPGTPGTDHHCQSNEGACENNPMAGWTAAASQFLFFNGGAGIGGSACGTCWRVTGSTDSSGNPMSCTPIVVMITNECAAQLPGQEVNLCGMSSLDQLNKLNATVNIDLCMDSGASQAFWGPPPWGTSVGTAHQVSCASEWCGTWSNGTKSGPVGCSAPGADWAVTTKE